MTKISQTFLGKKCPPQIWKWGRILLQSSQRRRLIRERQIQKSQDTLIQEQFNAEGANLVVYIVDGADWHTGREKISGGLLAIASYYEETKKLPEMSSYQVIICLLYTSPSPRDGLLSRMPSSA